MGSTEPRSGEAWALVGEDTVLGSRVGTPPEVGGDWACSPNRPLGGAASANPSVPLPTRCGWGKHPPNLGPRLVLGRRAQSRGQLTLGLPLWTPKPESVSGVVGAGLAST